MRYPGIIWVKYTTIVVIWYFFAVMHPGYGSIDLVCARQGAATNK